MPLAGPPEEYFHPERQGFLKLWMIQAEEAIAMRQAAIRESRAQTNYHDMPLSENNECGDYPVQLSSVYTLL